MFNQWTGIGNLGSDVEIRYTSQGTAVANVSMACNEKWKDKSGEQQERTEWVPLVFWGRKAEVAGEYLSKGSKIFVQGKLQTRNWEADDGSKRYKTEVVVNEFKFLDPRGSSGSGSHYDGYEPPTGKDDDDIPF